MTKITKLKPNGELRRGTTANRRVTPSTNVEKTVSTLDTSATTAEAQSQKASRPTENLSSPNGKFKALSALAESLGALTEWRKLKLKDGRVGWALFFDAARWQANGNSLEAK